MPPKFSVLIPDGESPFAYHVLTCLAQAGGMDVHVLSRKADVMSRYSHAKKSFTFLSLEEDLLESVKRFCSRVHVDLIMPVDMNALFYFADHREPASGIADLCLLEDPQELQIVSDKGL